MGFDAQDPVRAPLTPMCILFDQHLIEPYKPRSGVVWVHPYVL